MIKKSLKFHPNFFVRENELPYEEFLAEMSRFRFTLCPPGNGLSTFRDVESSMVESMPIMLDEIYTRAYYQFPVLKIKDWSVLNNPIEFFLDKLKQCVSFNSGLTPKSVMDILQ